MLLKNNDDRYITLKTVGSALDAKIGTAYGTTTGFSLLQDTTPAIEALKRIGLVTPEDYVKMGLVKKSHSSMEDIISVLEELRLSTFQDLKQARIYSKQSLARLF